MEMTRTHRTAWIGLVEVRPRPGNDLFEGCPGAFSNVLCLAGNAVEYQQVVGHEFAKMDLDVAEFQDVRPYEERADGHDDEIRELADHLSEDSPFDYDTFYVFESEEEE